VAAGTNLTGGVCHGGRPIFSPSPRAWPVMLGAADMPIGCALIFCCVIKRSEPGIQNHDL
jgi:hypothetical protein